MPRPPRCRRICGKPQIDTFCPNGGGSGTPILLTLDEYEVIRLVDLEQRTHEQCAAQMDISRSTVQEIYESARRKIAACLVYGRKLVITGGSYRICGGQEQARCKQGCRTKSEETHSNMQQHTLATPSSSRSMRSTATGSLPPKWSIPTAAVTARWRAS